MAAAFLFEKSLDLDDEAERSRIFEDLLTYCGQDTMAMVRLRQELAKRAAITRAPSGDWDHRSE